MAEPGPGRILTESGTGSGTVTTSMVTPQRHRPVGGHESASWMLRAGRVADSASPLLPDFLRAMLIGRFRRSTYG